MEYVADSTHEARVARCPCRACGVCEPGSKAICAIPFGCAPEPEQAPFVDVGLSFFAVGDGDEFSLEMTTSRSRTGSQSYPRARRGSTRVHQKKVYGAPGEYTLGS